MLELFNQFNMLTKYKHTKVDFKSRVNKEVGGLS